jgi:hypothetical protein
VLQELRPGQLSGPGGPTSGTCPDEIDKEYLIYGLFERADRPDGAFLSKRWCSLEDILEHTPPGLMLNKIREWEGGRAARAKRAVQELFNQAEAQLGEADAEAMPWRHEQMLSDGGVPAAVLLACTL